MQRIALIAMPLMDVDRPSLSLTQLRTVTERALGDEVAVAIHYVNHAFAAWLAEGRGPRTPDLHQVLCATQHVGLPDWFFRAEAFPEQPDNTEAYFRRYFPGRSAATFKEVLLAKRRGLGAFLDGAIERLELERTDLVGFTSMFAQNVASFALARRLKQRADAPTTVMGGPNCESPMGQVIARNVEAIDHVFSGPALVNFPEFVRLHGEGRRDACAALPGVLTAGATAKDGPGAYGPELPLDVDVPLDFSGFLDSFASELPEPRGEPTIVFETSRGCWWGARAHCTFCGLNGATMSYRAMPADQALALIEGLFEQCGVATDSFMAVDNIMPKEYVRDVFARLEPPPGKHLFYEVKADLDEQELEILARAGVRRLQPGIEALATPTLKLMKKGTSSFVNLRLLKSCRRLGIDAAWNLLVGFPGESEETYAFYVESLPRLAHLQPPQGAAPIRFDRYSPYFVQAEAYGLDLASCDFYGLIYPFAPEDLDGVAYYFADQNLQAEYVQRVARWIGRLAAVVADWNARWADGEPPRLELERAESGARVLDTRSGHEVVHALDPQALALLDALSRARGERDLVALGEDGGFDARARLRELEERALVWREGDRLMSLVLD